MPDAGAAIPPDGSLKAQPGRRGEAEPNTTAVVRIVGAQDQPGRHQAVGPLDSTVVLDTRSLGEISDSRAIIFRKALDRQQGPVLACCYRAPADSPTRCSPRVCLS